MITVERQKIKKKKEVSTMKFTIPGMIEELKKEVDRRLAASGENPEGFGASVFDSKLAILSEMYEREEELGIDPKKSTAYCTLADYYRACGSWN